MLTRTRGQTTAEYAILLSLVIAAAVAMQVYVKRGIQARVKSGTDAFTSVAGTIEVGDETAEFVELDQYEPYYLESSYDRYQENVEQEHMADGKIIKEKVSDISATAAGGYEKQIGGSSTQTTRDAIWEATTTGE